MKADRTTASAHSVSRFSRAVPGNLIRSFGTHLIAATAWQGVRLSRIKSIETTKGKFVRLFPDVEHPD